MTMLVCWVVFPLVLAAASAGVGLLLERAAGARLPGNLLVPAGFAGIVVVTTALTLRGATAPLATPAIVVLALLGVRGRERPRPNALTGAVLGVFAVAAAPVVLSGQATFAGYTQLDDISTFLAFAAHAIDHGRDLSMLAPSTFEATLADNFVNDYPLGAFVPLSALQPPVGQDLAWLWQPYLTFLLVVLALALWSLAAPLVPSTRLRAAVVFVAAQPALLYAYALQGGVKELATAALVATAAALALPALRGVRQSIPFLVAVLALPCVLSAGAVAYLGPLVAGAAIIALAQRRAAGTSSRRLAAIVGGAAVAAGVAGTLLLSSTAGFRDAGRGLLQNEAELGNLFGPLDPKQALGIWPAGDFRLPVGDGRALAYVLIAVLGVAALGGAARVLRGRAVGAVLFGLATIGALAGLATFGSSPWVEAKALAIASPAVVLLGALGATWLLGGRLRAVGVVALVAITAGVLWSNWLAYRDVRLAPRDRLAELATIGDRFAGQGPLVVNEYEPYGARYFLRDADPEAPAELRRRVVPLRDGEGLGKNAWAPLDQFQMPALETYRTIVVRRSPAESRPPAAYGLRWSGRYYDVFQRPEPLRSVVVSYAIFGDQLNAGELPPCDLVRGLAAEARRSGARLVGAVRAPAVLADLGSATLQGFRVTPGPPAQLTSSGAATARLAVGVPAAGTYDAWVRGSFGRGVELTVAGRPVGTTGSERSFTGQWIRVGATQLSAGDHELVVRDPGASLRPGNGRQPQTFGPVALVPRVPPPRLLDLAPTGRAAARLCTTPLDWLEVVRR